MYGQCTQAGSAALVPAATAANTSALARMQQGEPTPEDRERSFRPVEGGGDSRSGEMLLTVAYAVMWLMAFLLIVLSMRRQRRLDARIVQLSQDLERARKGEPYRGGVRPKGGD